jgi:hypothetical protein
VRGAESVGSSLPGTLAAFRAAFEAGQEIADISRTAVEQAMEALPPPPASLRCRRR